MRLEGGKHFRNGSFAKCVRKPITFDSHLFNWCILSCKWNSRNISLQSIVAMHAMYIVHNLLAKHILAHRFSLCLRDLWKYKQKLRFVVNIMCRRFDSSIFIWIFYRIEFQYIYIHFDDKTKWWNRVIKVPRHLKNKKRARDQE